MSRGARSNQFRPSRLTGAQARLGRRLLSLVGRRLFRFRFEFVGLENVPTGESVIVAAAPHRGWIDPFVVIIALPPTPRVYFLAAAEGMSKSWWKQTILWLMGGVVPVWSERPLNRESLETSLAILSGGNRLGIFPEGFGQTTEPPTELQPIKRGVAFLSERTGCRVLPVGLSGTHELWRGKTLRLRVGPILEALPADVPRPEEQVFADRIGEAIRAAVPPLPPEPSDGKKPWSWLTHLLG